MRINFLVIVAAMLLPFTAFAEDSSDLDEKSSEKRIVSTRPIIFKGKKSNSQDPKNAKAVPVAKDSTKTKQVEQAKAKVGRAAGAKPSHSAKATDGDKVSNGKAAEKKVVVKLNTGRPKAAKPGKPLSAASPK